MNNVNSTSSLNEIVTNSGAVPADNQAQSAGTPKDHVWILSRLMPIILTIAVLIYAIMMGAFFVDKWRKEQNVLLQRHTIDECLGSGGHVGPGASCRSETDKVQPKDPLLQ